jgi:aspartate carbamoyltransferase catalytic subunit
LRIQKERMKTLDPEEAEAYVHDFQITAADLGAKQKLMHPGPVNWGTELGAELAIDPRSLILKQVEMGLSLRSVVLEIISGEA